MRAFYFSCLLLLAACAGQTPREAKLNASPSQQSTAASGLNTVELATDENVTPLLTSARMDRVDTDGKMHGVRLTNIEAGSNWERAGFKDGDEVIAINGRPLQSRDDLIKLLVVMVQPQTSEIQVVRQRTILAPEHVEVLRVRAAR